jgi:putative transposon-encoded protein
MEKQMFKVTGYILTEKVVGDAGSSGRIFVSKQWLGKRVTVILNEPIEDHKEKTG